MCKSSTGKEGQKMLILVKYKKVPIIKQCKEQMIPYGGMRIVQYFPKEVGRQRKTFATVGLHAQSE